MSEAPNDPPPGHRLADRLDEFFSDHHKKFGMFGQIGWGVREVTPGVLMVGVSHRPAGENPETVALQIRDAMRDLLQDTVPCPRFRAEFGDGRAVDLDFCPGDGAPSRSPVILIEEHAEPYRQAWRPRLREAWKAVVEQGGAPLSSS